MDCVKLHCSVCQHRNENAENAGRKNDTNAEITNAEFPAPVTTPPESLQAE